ncbi:hypothetical protein [Yokenella regensburgei]|uniref:hypothetical protein n=1 Tax=Yokenella regensburgei TaxID=158877 RepID=UPI003EDA6DBE
MERKLVVGALLRLDGITHLATRPAYPLLMAILPTLVLPAIAVSLIQNYVPVSVKRFMPPRFFYFAYPGHLVLLALALWIPVS